MRWRDHARGCNYGRRGPLAARQRKLPLTRMIDAMWAGHTPGQYDASPNPVYFRTPVAVLTTTGSGAAGTRELGLRLR